MGRKANRQEMSGIFDFFKKKKPEQKSLFDVFAPGAGALIPAPAQKPGLPAAPKEPKKSLFSFLDPKPQLPAEAKPKKKALQIFEVLPPTKALTPAAPPSAPPSQPMADWGKMFPVQAEPQPSPATMFEKIMKAEEPPPKYVFIAPSSPPELKPRRPHSLPAPSTAPVVEWTLPTVSELADHFRRTMDLQAMWDEIRRARAHPQFPIDQIAYYEQGIPMIVPLDPIVYRERYTDFANFYGIPWSVMSMYLDVPPQSQKDGEEALWANVLSPLNVMLPEAFEMLKPDDLPGFFNASFLEPSGEYWLNYVEPLLTKPPQEPGGFSGA